MYHADYYTGEAWPGVAVFSPWASHDGLLMLLVACWLLVVGCWLAVGRLLVVVCGLLPAGRCLLLVV